MASPHRSDARAGIALTLGGLLLGLVAGWVTGLLRSPDVSAR